jgi:hypothetical protein
MQHYDVAMTKWPEVNAQGWLEDFFQNDLTLVAFWRSIFTQVYDGQIDTWDYQLTLSFWLRGMISICPARNLISNIGFGSDATHTKDANPRANMPVYEMKFPLIAPSALTADSLADEFAAWSVYSVPAFKGSLRMQMLFNQSPPALYALSEQQRQEYCGNIVSLAAMALQGGDAAIALELTELCAKIGSRIEGLFYMKGLCSLALGDKQSAKASLEIELSRYPNNTQARAMYSTL